MTSIQVKGVKGGRSYKPYAFTEQGIYMLMTVLKGDLAVQQSMALIRLFKRLKDYAVSEGLLLNGTEVTPLVLQTAQNTRDIADVSADVKVLSGEVHEMRGEFSKDAGNKITTIMQIEYTQAYHSIMEMLRKEANAENCDSMSQF